MDLKGVRIWLAGSIPENTSDKEREAIESFVIHFSDQVFKLGGTIVHGAHPSIEPLISKAAQSYFATTKTKSNFVQVVSRKWSKEWTKEKFEAINRICTEPVIQTMESLNKRDEREASLKILRQTLAEQANVFVAIGGRWWNSARAMAGIPNEIKLAKEHQLPLFFLGGMGGATKEFLIENGDLLKNCRNGLSAEDNNAITTNDNPSQVSSVVLNQIARLPLRRGMPKAGRPFRILCLDGGGIRGAYTASVLKYWEERSELSIVDHFDLIAGTSTGGILAIGLGLGLSATQMLEFYEKEGPEIFPSDTSLKKWWHGLKHWFSNKFDQAVLKKKLEVAYHGNDSLDNSRCRLIVPAYNRSIDSPIIFRTPHGPFENTDRGTCPVESALATAAAPSYFDTVDVEGTEAIDGGVWANCPGIVAISEAVGKLGISIDQIEMLSIGTTSTPIQDGKPLLLDKTAIGKLVSWVGVGWLTSTLCKILWKPVRIEGKIGWVANIAGLLMKTQGQTIEYACKSILADRFLRVDFSTPKIELDEATKIAELVAYGKESGEEFAEEVAKRFLNGIPASGWK